MTITAQEILAQRLYHQALLESKLTGAEVLAKSLGIQSQYVTHGIYNYFNRLANPKADSYADLTEQGILAWGQRGTYHFYDRPTWEGLSLLLSETVSWPWHHLAEQGVEVTAQLERLAGYLADGPLTREALKDRYGQEEWRQLFRWGGLFLAASRQGQLYQTLSQGDRLVHWQLAPGSQDLLGLKKQLLATYFSFYGPATLGDAAHFFGVPQTFFSQVDLSDWPSCRYGKQTFYYQTWQEAAKLPTVLVLGKFDALLVSYKSKDILVEKDRHHTIWQKAGQIPALILIRGQVKGEWNLRQQGDQITFQVTSAQPLAKAHQATIRARFKAFARWWGKKVKAIDFVVES